MGIKKKGCTEGKGRVSWLWPWFLVSRRHQWWWWWLFVVVLFGWGNKKKRRKKKRIFSPLFFPILGANRHDERQSDRYLVGDCWRPRPIPVTTFFPLRNAGTIPGCSAVPCRNKRVATDDSDWIGKGSNPGPRKGHSGSRRCKRLSLFLFSSCLPASIDIMYGCSSSKQSTDYNSLLSSSSSCVDKLVSEWVSHSSDATATAKNYEINEKTIYCSTSE